jgi:hypothetical protein
MQVTPLDFFQKHCGSKIDPDADARSVLMRGYLHADESRVIKPKKPKKGEATDEAPKPVMTRLGGHDPARFLISEDVSSILATVRFEKPVQGISLALQATRKPRDWMVDIIMSPPKPPFLACSLGLAASDLDFWRLTLSSDLIIFSGSTKTFGVNVLMVDRPRFLAAVDWFKKTSVSVSELLRLTEIQYRFKSGLITGEKARADLSKLKTPKDVLQSYPGEDDPFIRKLAYFAATEWEPK